MSLLLGSAGPTFTHQMHPLHLYLEADRAPQAQQGQNCTCGRLSPTQPASARDPLCVRGPKHKSAPRPQVTLHVHVLLTTTPSLC